MAGTYCGKSCTDCSYKEKLGCQGCKVGPGAGFYSDCELARCCKKCGHDSCGTCVNITTCKLHRGRMNAAEFRYKRQENQKAEHARISSMASGMINCFTTLFVCLIFNVFVSFFSDDLFVKNFPVLKIVGVCLVFIVQLVYFIVLLRMSSTEEAYKIPAYIGIVSVLVYLPVNIHIVYSDGFTIFTVLNLFITVAMAAARYYECTAHSTLFFSFSDMSDKWERHWKWYIRILIARIASVLLVLISPLLGVILMLIALIASVVVDIQRIVYLHMSIEDFVAIYNKR